MKSADPTQNDEGLSTVTEATPLLGAGAAPTINGNDSKDAIPAQANGHAASDQHEDQPEEEKPMPHVQILLLCYASLAEPVAYFAIFPFINEMIYRTGGLDESDVGFWTGMIESLFSLVQMVLMIFYGRAADRLGRKPVLVFSLAGVSVATALFGMSQTLWQMIMFRCMAGLFAGSVVTIRTMISENCTKRSQARAFSWYMFTKNAGIFVGPIIGGGLADPATNFPRVFGGVAFFENYPYALATFVAGFVCFTATLTSLFGLEETLKRNVDGSDKPKPEMTTWEVLNSPGVPMVLYIFAHTMLLALAFTAISPVFLFTSVELGGLGFKPQWIAGFLTLAGGSQALWMLLAFPPLQKHYSTGGVLRACANFWPLMFISFPLLNETLRHGWITPFWVLGTFNTVIGSGVSMAFACVQLCLNDVSPSSTVLATVNALALTVNSGVRAFAPVAFTSLFAAGVRLGWADGHLAWFFLVTMAAGLRVALYWLPKAAEGRYEKLASAPEQDNTSNSNGGSEQP